MGALREFLRKGIKEAGKVLWKALGVVLNALSLLHSHTRVIASGGTPRGDPWFVQ